MAKFDTEDPKTNDPSYLGYSQGTDRAGIANIPMPRDLTIPAVPKKPTDTSLGELFKGFGETVSNALTATDQVVKLSAEKTLQDGIDKIRDDFGVGQAAEISKDGPPPISVLGAEDVPVPPAVSKVGNQVQGLYDAYQQGKLSNSYYYGRLEAFVRQVKEQYPGYRDYVDQVVQKTTGVTPANALRTALLQDTQELYKKLQGGTDKFQAFERSHGAEILTALPDYYQRKAAGNPYSQLETEAGVARVTAKNFQATSEEKQLELKLKNRAVSVEEVGDFANNRIDVLTDGILQAAHSQAGDILKKAEELRNSGQSPDPQQEMQARAALGQLKQTAQTQVQQELSKPIYNNLSIDKKNAIVKQAMDKFQVVDDALLNKDYGMLAMNGIIVKSRDSYIQRKMYDQSDIWSVSKQMREALGNEGFARFLSDPRFSLLEDQYKAAVTYTTGRAGQNVGYTADQAVKSLMDAKVKDGNVYDQVITRPLEILKDNKTDPKALPGYVNFFFGPENKLLRYVDPNPSKGPSQSQVYERLLAPDVTERMFQLGKDKPEYWQKYKTWAETNFKTMFKAAADDLSDLAKNNLYYQTPSYDPVKNEIYLKNVRNYTVRSDRVDTMNNALRAIKPIFEKDGRKLSEELPQLLADMGVRTITLPPEETKK